MLTGVLIFTLARRYTVALPWLSEGGRGSMLASPGLHYDDGLIINCTISSTSKYGKVLIRKINAFICY